MFRLPHLLFVCVFVFETLVVSANELIIPIVLESPDSSIPNYNTSPLEADRIGVESDAQALANKMVIGWNMGNTLEAIGGETAWGNPMITPNLIQLIKDSGFNAIRLPVSWNQYANQETYQIDPNWMNRIKEIVQWCVERELYVLINIHWDEGWLENNIEVEKQAAVSAKQKAYWEQIATAMRDFDEHLLFASANEPHVEDAEGMQVLNHFHQVFIDAVRSTGGKNAYRVLVLQGPITDIEKTHDLMTWLPTDTVPNRIMTEVHFYTPYNFALMREDADWGRQFYYWGEANHSTTDPLRNPTWGEEDTVEELFGLMKQQFVANGIPVILGEYSAMRRSDLTGDDLQLHKTSRAYYHEFVTRSAIQNGLIPFYWDNGGLDNHSSGIFDRQNQTVFDDLTLEAVMKGASEHGKLNPDQDWANNGMESFLGSDPSDGSSIPVRPEVSLNETQLLQLRVHRFARVDAPYEVKSSNDLEEWIPFPMNVVEDTETVLTLASAEVVSMPPLYLRLELL